MREILFRGRSVEHNMWVGGDLTVVDGKPFILMFKRIDDGGQLRFKAFEVVPETVGQWTGSRDKNGVKIFEGDIIRCPKYYHSYEVMFRDGCFCTRWYCETFEHDVYEALYDNEREKRFETELYAEVVGNIYETPELLEETRSS